MKRKVKGNVTIKMTCLRHLKSLKTSRYDKVYKWLKRHKSCVIQKPKL